MANIDDISMKDLKEKAKIIAEGTGRSYESVLEDLLDDGVVNLSNEQKKDGSLVDQLKEAAELIATVQSISNQVSENTVLNGADNKTEVVVESTLEGDLIDRAIDSVQRKADNIKKILITLAPVFLLLTGGSLEAIGITDFVGSDDYEDDETYLEYGGCLAPDADNYDPDASWDDGTCYWENHSGTGPPDCYDNWRWDSEDFYIFNADGGETDNDLQVRFTFRDDAKCNYHMNNGYFEIVIDGNSQTFAQNFNDQYMFEHDFFNLYEGQHYIEVYYRTNDGSEWAGPTRSLIVEDKVAPCDHDIVVDKLILSATANDLNLYVEYHDNNGCGAAIEMQFATYHNSGYTDSFMVTDGYNVANSGSTYFNIDRNDNEIMAGVEDGDWSIEFRWWVIGENENCCDYTNTVTIDEDPEPCDAHIDNLQAVDNNNTVTVSFYLAQGQNTECNDWDVEIELLPTNGSDIRYHEQNIGETSNYYTYTFTEVRNAEWRALVVLYQNENCESDCVITDEYSEPVTVDWSPEPETCDIVIYEITLFTNTTHAIVNYDLDCGTNTNELEGYNVSVQFLIYQVGNMSADSLVVYDTATCYIQGYTGDLKTLTLTDFSDANKTHYDIYFIGVWIDSKGNTQSIQQTWLNHEMNP